VGPPDWSGRRDSNSRPSPWQGDALPLSYFRDDCGVLNRVGPFSLPGMAGPRDENRCMTDGALVFLILTLGGLFYMALMLWTTVISVRESDANNPPPGAHH
jgi:hypothetical protein